VAKHNSFGSNYFLLEYSPTSDIGVLLKSTARDIYHD